MRFLILFLNYLPKNLISFLTGALARLRLPVFLQVPLNKAFIGAFGIDTSEAAEELTTKPSIEDIFIRYLKPGLRPLKGPFCSPCDGTLSQSGICIAGDFAVQAKGVEYSMSELMACSRKYHSFATIYLAPHNYHRVHSPVAGTLVEIVYVPGELWPVNQLAVRWVPQLFCRNERMIFRISTDAGIVDLAMVGALNVGRIATPFWPDFIANSRKRQFGGGKQATHAVGAKLELGAELGVFMLGSTVVLGLDLSLGQSLRLPTLSSPKAVLLGQALASPV